MTLPELQLRLTLLVDHLRQRSPGQWPRSWRMACATVLPLAVLAGGALLVLQPQWQQLDAMQRQEAQLQAALVVQLKQAAALPDTVQHRQALAEGVKLLANDMLPAGDTGGLEEQLAVINRLGVARHLRFDKFQRGAEITQSGYAALPIAVNASGTFNDVLGFVEDIARLPRLVTLSGLQLQARPQDQALALDATVTVYRQTAASALPEQGKQR